MSLLEHLNHHGLVNPRIHFEVSLNNHEFTAFGYIELILRFDMTQHFVYCYPHSFLYTLGLLYYEACVKEFPRISVIRTYLRRITVFFFL